MTLSSSQRAATHIQSRVRAAGAKLVLRRRAAAVCSAGLQSRLAAAGCSGGNFVQQQHPQQGIVRSHGQEFIPFHAFSNGRRRMILIRHATVLFFPTLLNTN